MAIIVVSIGIFDLALKLAIKLPPDVIHRMQGVEGLFLSPLVLLGFNAFLTAGFLAIFLTHKDIRYYPVRVIAFGMLFAALIGQLLLVFVPWRS